MEIPVGLQLWQLAAAVVCGGLIGAVHDTLGPLRRGGRRRSALADGILCAALWLMLFGLGMWVGRGQQRPFLAAFAALGSGLYLLLLSPIMRILADCLWTAAGFLLHLGLYPVKELLNVTKKLLKKLAIPIKALYNHYVYLSVKRAGKAAPGEEEHREEKTGKYVYGAGAPSFDRLHGLDSGGALRQDKHRRKAGRGTAAGKRQTGRGKRPSALRR